MPEKWASTPLGQPDPSSAASARTCRTRARFFFLTQHRKPSLRRDRRPMKQSLETTPEIGVLGGRRTPRLFTKAAAPGLVPGLDARIRGFSITCGTQEHLNTRERPFPVIPAKAGIQPCAMAQNWLYCAEKAVIPRHSRESGNPCLCARRPPQAWIPAFAGMTEKAFCF